ncbi:hypothetical protein OSB04_031077 [Centaurea solstitialis]|uniref:Uncharacterized protein n=1 Tax=Centaurea solstitialis TaxID=347529 RepID=A0AA38SA19_9ASTR|nr:hypothetical protein OSB04_031077 [Centaurea solstitialis]
MLMLRHLYHFLELLPPGTPKEKRSKSGHNLSVVLEEHIVGLKSIQNPEKEITQNLLPFSFISLFIMSSPSPSSSLSFEPPQTCRQFTILEIHIATRNFDEGFGKVYRGTITNNGEKSFGCCH